MKRLLIATQMFCILSALNQNALAEGPELLDPVMEESQSSASGAPSDSTTSTAKQGTSAPVAKVAKQDQPKWKLGRVTIGIGMSHSKEAWLRHALD